MKEPIAPDVEPSQRGSDKDLLRQRAKRNRASLSVDHRRICDALRHFFETDAPEGWIVVFDAMPNEPDVAALLDDRPHRRLALTRTPERGRLLTVHDARSARERHPFGYSQPTEESPIIPDEEIGTVLVPGLAFDRQGGRLGFGAGFYDRFLARLTPNVARIGVSDGFVVDRLPTDDHDVAMTHLATEAGVVPLPLGQSTPC